MGFDFIIVGAGTAGCVLADRLSASGEFSVCLLEAGGQDDYFWIPIPVGYLFTIGNPRTDWMFKTEPEPGLSVIAVLGTHVARFWAAAPQSMPWSICVARPATMTIGHRWAIRAGVGRMFCRYFETVRTTCTVLISGMARVANCGWKSDG